MFEKEGKNIKTVLNIIRWQVIFRACVKRPKKTDNISSSAAHFFGMKKEFNQYDLFEPIAEVLNMSSMVDIMPAMYAPMETLEHNFFQSLGEIFRILLLYFQAMRQIVI